MVHGHGPFQWTGARRGEHEGPGKQCGVTPVSTPGDGVRTQQAGKVLVRGPLPRERSRTWVSMPASTVSRRTPTCATCCYTSRSTTPLSVAITFSTSTLSRPGQGGQLQGRQGGPHLQETRRPALHLPPSRVQPLCQKAPCQQRPPRKKPVTKAHIKK